MCIDVRNGRWIAVEDGGDHADISRWPWMTRFEREAQAVAAPNHANIGGLISGDLDRDVSAEDEDRRLCTLSLQAGGPVQNDCDGGGRGFAGGSVDKEALAVVGRDIVSTGETAVPTHSCLE